MRSLLIIGAGGHGKVVADAAEQTRQWQDIFFCDDRYPRLSRAGCWRVAGNSRIMFDDKTVFDDIIVAIGDNKTRFRLHQDLLASGYTPTSVIHPSAIIISPYVTIGHGCVVFAGAVINIDCKIGQASIINTSATLDHDCCLGNSVHIAPGASIAGGVRVGDYSWIGIGASIKQLVSIGQNVTLGAGAVAVNDLGNGIVATGIPAKPV